MALRNIVKIDEEKCNGCGLCVGACAEGAIQMIDGKAKLVAEIYCDGLGACLGCCPVDAITIEQREADEFDEEATQQYLAELAANKAKLEQKQAETPQKAAFSGCPGMKMMNLDRSEADNAAKQGDTSSQLAQWPVQLKLVSPAAPYFAGADILLVADCVAFAMGDFHEKLLKGKAVAIACPKLDDRSGYIEKIAEILTTAKPKSLTVVHMEVPCCSGLGLMAQAAVDLSGVDLEIGDITVSLKGEII